MRCYVMKAPAEDPQMLLREERQQTGPWAGGEDGTRCEKCRGSGRTGYECWSCLLTGTSSSCPACHGRVRWEGECPLCRGTGEVDGKPRNGVRAFPSVESLYHRLLADEADLVGMLVELEAEPAEDVDFDADQGVLLVIPTAIGSVRPVEPDAIETIKGLAER